MNISVIIFGYNEQESLKSVFCKTLEFLQEFSDSFEIIIVNDGSTDKSGDICKEISQMHYSVKVVNHSTNMGIGMALRSGYETATKEYVCAIPADGQFDINELEVIKPFEMNFYYSFYRSQTDYSFYRRCLTWGNRMFNQHVLSVFLRDVNWIKVYRRDQLRLTKPILRSSLIESEICSKLFKAGILPIEIPSKYLPRNSGVAKGGNWNTLKNAILETLRLWWVVIRFKL